MQPFDKAMDKTRADDGKRLVLDGYELVLKKTLERHRGAHLRIINDDGLYFIGRNFKEFIRRRRSRWQMPFASSGTMSGTTTRCS
jgi:hypothetical protein